MSDWREVRISELSTIDIGGTPSRAISAFWVEKPVGHPWISIADLKGKYVFETKEHITALGVRSSNVKLIPANTTVMSFKLTVGRTAITGREMFCNEAIAIFQPKDERLNGQWLYHALPKAATSVVTDTAVKGATLNKAKMAEMTLNLPPLVEQIKIAEILDTLDTAIHETEAIIAKLKAVKQGLLHDLLTRGIAANGELRPPQAEAPHLYKQSPLGWIPKEWEVKTVSEIAEVKSGATPSREQPNRYFGLIGIPWVKTLDLNEDLIRATDESITATALRETSCSLLPEGTVLVAMYGGWEQIGRTALLAVPAATNQAISSLLMRSSSTVPEFVLRALQHARPRWHAVAASTRKDPNITKADVLAFAIPMPTPDEQAEIAHRLRTCLDRLELEGSTLAKLRHQKSALMDDLLTGRVRVTPLLEAAAP